ncbi:MAG TPA: hypothetical protein VJN68_05355, partial [Burkholderiaceae bacterium]|nr:hypothetical protein [Burkholderiaceae bacterium]
MIPNQALLITKLSLVAASMLGASLLARRYGHAVSGALAGLPVIVGPIIAILLIDLPAERVRSIALATLACEPAMLLDIVVFAHAARRFAWPAGGRLADAPVGIQASELWWRLAAALLIAATVMWGADHFPAAIAGALLALPIAGSVLPCFTL